MKKIFIILLVFVLFSCKDEDKKTPVDIFTANLTYGDDAEAWIIAWNSKGELLDYKTATTNATTVLSTKGDISDGKITVAFLVHYPGTYVDVSVKVYADLPVGQTFTTKTVPATDYQVDDTKKFSVTLPSTGEYRFLNITNKWGYSAGGGSSTDAFDCQYCYLLKDNSEYNFMYRTDESVRHKLLTGMKENDVINLTEDDFTPYDHEVTYTYPVGTANLILAGYQSDVPKGGPGMLLDLYLSGTYSHQITTGYYGSSFNRFSFNFSSSQGVEHGYYEYLKMGALPTELNVPNLDGYSVTNRDPFNMAANTQSSLFHNAEWSHVTRDASNNLTSVTVWHVTTSSAQTKIGAIPDELMAKFPTLTIDENDYREARFYLGPQTYLQYVGVLLEGNWWDDSEQTDIAVFE